MENKITKDKTNVAQSEPTCNIDNNKIIENGESNCEENKTAKSEERRSMSEPPNTNITKYASNGKITHSNSLDSGTECNNGSEEATTSTTDVSNLNSIGSEDGRTSSSDIDSIPPSPLNSNNNDTADAADLVTDKKRLCRSKNKHLDKAAKLFQKGEYKQAAEIYTKCLEDLKDDSSKDIRLSLLFNRSATYLKMVSTNWPHLLTMGYHEVFFNFLMSVKSIHKQSFQTICNVAFIL